MFWLFPSTSPICTAALWLYVHTCPICTAALWLYVNVPYMHKFLSAEYRLMVRTPYSHSFTAQAWSVTCLGWSLAVLYWKCQDTKRQCWFMPGPEVESIAKMIPNNSKHKYSNNSFTRNLNVLWWYWYDIDSNHPLCYTYYAISQSRYICISFTTSMT